MPNTNRTAEIIEFPGQSFRAAIGEYWMDGTLAECLVFVNEAAASEIYPPQFSLALIDALPMY